MPMHPVWRVPSRTYAVKPTGLRIHEQPLKQLDDLRKRLARRRNKITAKPDDFLRHGRCFSSKSRIA